MDQETKSGSQGLPKVAIIVAMTKDMVIGSDNNLPWHLPEDLQLFKRLTTGGTLIMGRKTFQSIGKPLPGRNNLVISRKLLTAPGIRSCSSLISALSTAATLNKPVFVIGGAEIYKEALPITTELNISWIEREYPGDIFFPKLNLDDWNCIEEKVYPEFCYKKYLRKQAC